MLWVNATIFNSVETVFDSMHAIEDRMAVPIGNWALLGQLIEPVLVEEEVVENHLCWGFAWKENVSANEERRISVEYLKSDGLLARYIKEEWDVATNIRTSCVKVTRQELV
jgi:hypothetical protein